ncbi:MAG: arginine--tRNA ligase [Candidatus Thermoplasmatota archaeon]|nr:arginine--tRNA ligase [Candidatus Thermoplasmatota archaeon]MCL5963520.1 arginine--tRNA ligase [Candidatus Thermoplasmatota archaeon]
MSSKFSYILNESIEYITSNISLYMKSRYNTDDKTKNFIMIKIDKRNNKNILSTSMFWAKNIKNAKDLANEIYTNINWSIDFFEKVEAVNGYVNFYINFKTFNLNVIKKVIELKDEYGKGNLKNKKVVIEHTSANPTGPIHIGRTRNSIIGDSLSNIFRFSGYDVKTQFFLNDIGRQIAILTYGVEKDFQNSEYSVDDVLNSYIKYSNEEKHDEHLAKVIDNRLSEMETNENVIMANKKIIELPLKNILNSLKNINITFDEIVWESNFLKNRMIPNLLDKLKSSNIVKNDNGVFFIAIDEENIYLTRSNGTTLYILRDLAYNIYKLNNFDTVITVLGEDHKKQYDNIMKILKMMLPTKTIYPIFYSFVTMSGSKMSTRKGTSVSLNDLYDEAIKRAKIEMTKRRNDLSDNDIKKISKIIAVGAIRYNMIKIQFEKVISFDWDDALNFEGNSAPFIQYAYTRAKGILNKKDIDAGTINIAYDLLDALEIELIFSISQFPSIVKEVSENYRVHALAIYLYQLADKFNRFYDNIPVLHAMDINIVNARLLLVYSVSVVLENGLKLLGIETPPFM